MEEQPTDVSTHLPQPPSLVEEDEGIGGPLNIINGGNFLQV